MMSCLYRASGNADAQKNQIAYIKAENLWRIPLHLPFAGQIEIALHLEEHVRESGSKIGSVAAMIARAAGIVYVLTARAI